MNAPKLVNNHDDKFRGFKSFKEAAQESYYYNIIPRDIQIYLRHRYGLKNSLKLQILEEFISIDDGFAPSEKEMCFRLNCYPNKYHEAVKDLVADGYLWRNYNDEKECNILSINWNKLWEESDAFAHELYEWKKHHNAKEPFKFDEWYSGNFK